MRILDKDQEILEKNWPGAVAHIRAAELRFEHFSLLCRNNNGALNSWEKNRLDELEGAPAVTEVLKA